MTRIATILIGLTFLTSCDCLQQVAGTVVDKETGRPIQGVTVYNKNKNWVKTTTDTTGHFELSSISGGFRCPPMTVVTEYSAYQQAEFLIPAGGQRTLEIERKPFSNFKDSTCIPNPDTLDGQIVYNVTDKKAEFPYGQDSLMRYLAKSIKYPNHIEYQGSVYIAFIIDSNGKIRNVCSYKRFHSDRLTPIEKECIRVIEEMPDWTPAELNGQRVYSREILPIKFKLSDND